MFRQTRVGTDDEFVDADSTSSGSSLHRIDSLEKWGRGPWEGVDGEP